MTRALSYCLAEAGIQPSQPMFNAGILLIDLKAYREGNVEPDCLAFLQRWRNEVRSADQDALNAVLHDRWKQLDFCWNVQMGGWERFKTHPALTADEQKLLRQTDPAILHFSGSCKPWNSGLRSAYCRTYIETLNQTGWFGQTEFFAWRAKRLAVSVRTSAMNQFASFMNHRKQRASPAEARS